MQDPAMAGAKEPPRYRCVYLSGLRTVSESDMGHKLYIFESDAFESPHPLVYWELRHMYQRLSISTPLARWLNLTHIPRVEGTLQSLGLEAGGLRMSMKALWSHGGPGCARDDGGPYLQEWTVSSLFMLVYLLDWSANLKKAADKVAASSMLSEILGKAFPSIARAAFEAWGAPTGDEMSLCQKALGGGRCPHMIVGQAEVWARGNSAHLDLVGILGSLFGNVSECPAVAAWLRRLLQVCADCIDCASCQNEVHSARHDPGTIAHPRGRKRSRRLDVDLVAYVATDLVGRKKFRSAAAAARGLGIMAPRTAHDTEETFMSQYLSATFKQLQNRCYMFLSMDGGRIGGKERLFTCCWSHDAQIAALLP